MTTDLIKRMGGFVALCLAQALIFNRIHLLDCATPLLYVYLIIITPHDYPRWGILLWSFMLGLAVDIFSNTPGVAAASLTLVGAVQPYFFNLFIPREAPDDIAPSVETMGVAKFVFYATVLVLLHCLAFFALETFHFFNLLYWLECVGGSTALTVLLMVTLESVRKR